MDNKEEGCPFCRAVKTGGVSDHPKFLAYACGTVFYPDAPYCYVRPGFNTGWNRTIKCYEIELFNLKCWVQTEQELHAAWEKRAYEAEAELQETQDMQAFLSIPLIQKQEAT